MPTITNDMVERAAVAIYGKQSSPFKSIFTYDECRVTFRDQARAALEAALGGDS